MDIRAQQPAGEHGHGVSQVDNGAAGQGPHEQPLGLLVWRRGGRQDLQAADAVEEQGQGAEVGVGAEGGLRGGGVLRRGFEQADLVAGRGGEAVEGGQGGGGEVQVGVEVGEEEGEDSVGGVDVGGEEGAVVGEDGGGGERGGEGEDVVFGDLRRSDG